MRRGPSPPFTVQIEKLSHEGRGVGRVNGKIAFVAGALAGESVTARVVRRRRQFDDAQVISVEQASPDRVVPRCPHAEVCGGCSLQHLEPGKQLAHKQAVLAELLAHHGGVDDCDWLPPLEGPLWGYRRKARLGVKHVPKKGGVLVGFREKGSPYIADIGACDVLDPSVGQRLLALRELVGQLSIRARLPQIEVAIGDDGGALVLRHLDPLTADDRDCLAAFQQSTGLALYLQPGGPDSVVPLLPDVAPLSYRLDTGAGPLDFTFLPTDFTQVNFDLNRAMVNRALEVLAPGPDDRVLDLFCGLGNFTLPLAQRAARVTGVEGDFALVERARANARANDLANVTFEVMDLAKPEDLATLDPRPYNKVLLDPPRTGADGVLAALDLSAVERLVYVSCNPVTLARDTRALRETHGFRLVSAGVMDMFPHTAHVESMALFARG